jgi:hypothetical protein
MDDKVQKDILHELQTIKRLLAHSLFAEDESQTKRIEKLDSVGFRPKEIAEILGTSANTVNVALTKIRKSKGR